MKYFLIIISLTIIFSACNVEETMKQRIDDANYCKVDSDCAVIRGMCPFGCWIPLHVSEAKGIEAQLSSYNPASGPFSTKCEYSCVMINTSNVKCEENKCVIKE